MNTPDSVKSEWNKRYQEANDKLTVTALKKRLIVSLLSRTYCWILNHTKYYPGERILDLGCGGGLFCLYLSQRFGTICEGIDVSEKGIEIARYVCGQLDLTEKCSFTVSDIQKKLRHQGTLVDKVLLLQVSEYFQNKSQLFSSINRNLKPNGLLIIITPESVSPPVGTLSWWKQRPWLRKLFHRAPVNEFNSYYYLISKQEMYRILSNSGFKILSSGYFGYPVWQYANIVSYFICRNDLTKLLVYRILIYILSLIGIGETFVLNFFRIKGSQYWFIAKKIN